MNDDIKALEKGIKVFRDQNEEYQAIIVAANDDKIITKFQVIIE